MKRYERQLEWGAVIYIVGVFVALYVDTVRDWSWQIPPGWIVAALGPGLVFLGVLAVYTGEAGSSSGRIHRSESPIYYWLHVSILFAFGILVFLAGIMEL